MGAYPPARSYGVRSTYKGGYKGGGGRVIPNSLFLATQVPIALMDQ